MIEVWITDTVSHSTVCYADLDPWDGDFIWSEGNFACDCNRGLFFARAAGLDEETFGRICGDNRYEIHVLDNTNGSILYSELLD